MKQCKIHTGWLVTAMVVILLVIDQIIKLYIKTHFYLGESVRVTEWFFIDFVENNGMAWGMSFINKLTLSLVRTVAIIVLLCYLRSIIKAGTHRLLYIYMVALVTTGAIGNMIDSMFYGLVFNASSEYYTSYWVPFGNGYAPFLMGKVVDMFYFPLIVTTWPDWVPFVGGNPYVFFSPIFNFADASISVGVVLLLLFYRKEISEISIKKKNTDR